jgi:plastocyanin
VSPRLSRLTVTAAVSVLLASALIASGCGSSGSSNGRTVQIDGHSKAYNATFTSYFPKRVVVHPGNTVSFHENWTGEPHSVTMGTLVEKGLAAAAHSNPNGPPPHAFAILPTMLPQGPGDVVQAGARPCYLETGAPPQNPKTPCPQVAQPVFNGTQTYYSSGWIKPGETWKVRLAANIKPGTYHYYCTLHGAMMSGSIVVVPKSQSIPSQSQDDATGRAELAKLVAAAEPAFRAAQSGHYPVHGNLAGVVSQSEQNVGINEFVAKTVHAKVGQPVSWTFLGAHTLTLGGPDNDEPILETAKDGSIHLRPSAVAPAGGPGAPPPPTGSSSSQPSTKVVHGGSYSGGLHSTGLVLSFPPQLTGYSLTFSKPGTYTFDCLVHPHMEGKVVVTQ